MIKMRGLLPWFGFWSHSLLNELTAHVMYLVSFGLCLEEVGEEEELQDAEDDEELQQDDEPQRTPPCHLAEAVGIESGHGLDDADNGHTHAGSFIVNYSIMLKQPQK